MNHRFDVLDSFRGLAAIFVVIFHIQIYSSVEPNAFFKSSDIFVDFFFILSGFVITLNYEEKIKENLKFKRYVVLRFARLYPLHLFMLFVWLPFIVVKIFLYQKGYGNTDPYIHNNFVSFLENLLLFQGGGWNYPSWSIGAEFYTYILYFILIFFIKKVNVILFNTLLIITVVVSFYLSQMNLIVEYILPLYTFGLFVLGGLIFKLYRYTYHLFSIKSDILISILQLILIVLIYYSVSKSKEVEVFHYLTIIVFSISVYFFSVFDDRGWISIFFKQKLFLYLGKISYSIYLVHAIIVTVFYNLFVVVFKYEKNVVNGIPSGIIHEYAFFINILILLIVIFLSNYTYKYIELNFQKKIKRRFIND